MGVGIRGPVRHTEHLSTGTGEDVVEARDVLHIPVTQEELDLDALALEVIGDVPRPLGDPGPMRAGGHPCDPDPSTPKLDEEQDVEPVEQDRVDREEVGGHDMGCLGSQQGPPRGPRSPRGRPDSVVLQDPGDRARRQPDAELDQLSLDPAVAPPGVLLGQTDNEP